MHRTPNMPERIFFVLGLSIVLASAVPVLNPPESDTGNRDEKITPSNNSHESNISVSATADSSNLVNKSIQSRFDPSSVKTATHEEKLENKGGDFPVIEPPVEQSRRFDGLGSVASKAKSSSYAASENDLNKEIQSRTVGPDNPTHEASAAAKSTQLKDNDDDDEKGQEETARHSAESRLRSARKPHVEGQDRYPAKITPPVVLKEETSELKSVKSDTLAQTVPKDLLSVTGKQSEAKGVENEPAKQANFQNIGKPNDQIVAPSILSEKNPGAGRGFKKNANVVKAADDEEEEDEPEEDPKGSQDIGGAQLKPPNRPKVSNIEPPSVDRFRFAATKAELTADVQGGRRLLPPYLSKSMKPKIEPAPKLSDINSGLLSSFPIDKTSQDEFSFPVEYILMVICLIVIVVMLLWRRLWYTLCTVCTRKHSASETGGHRYKASYKPLSASA